MANNCDYCHKPLSLMRRLRGEQFCSLEHMDQYEAQQAEFALERLAASVTERPNTERPPALPRPVLRSRTQESPTDAVASVATLPSPPAAQSAVALQEPDTALVVETRTLSPTPAIFESEFPMAAYLTPNRIEPRTLESKGRKTSESDPLDHWGKVSPSWSMPAFHSEPGDPRTWNAGKLASQIPPVAGWRELLVPKPAQPIAASDVDPQLPYLTVTVEQITAIPARAPLRNVFPERLTEFKTLQIHRGTVASTMDPEAPAHFAWTGPVFTTAAESVRSTFRIAESRPKYSAHLQPATRLQALVFEWKDIGGAQIAPSAPVPGALSLAVTGIQGLQTLGVQRSSWGARIGISAGAAENGTTEGPAMPTAACTLPHPAGWSWTPTFRVPPVTLPELLPTPMAEAKRAGEAWQEPQGKLQNPAIQWTAPHLGYNGATFGWESATGRPAENHGETAAEPARGTEIDLRIQEFRAHVRAGLSAPGHVLLGWSTLKLDRTKLEVGPLVNLRPTVTAMTIQVRPLLPFRTAHLESVDNSFSRLVAVPGPAPELTPKRAMRNVPAPVQARRIGIPGPAPAFRRANTTSRTAVANTQAANRIAQMGPMKYSPVAIVVVPPPQFALLPAVLSDEQRYVAQTPNGVWRLPRVRHTGYRALGPFPKLPLRLPDRYLKTSSPEVPPAFEEIPRQRVAVVQNLSGMPSFAAPLATRVHPADYFTWPQPKGIKTSSLLQQVPDSPKSSEQARLRRFGPGRAGLQSGNRSADGLARGRA
ncbi:MAG: hypothetical protein ABIR70_15515 [Bryobacteraceae bacterium]